MRASRRCARCTASTAASSTASPSTASATAAWRRSSSRTSSRACGATPTSSTPSRATFRTWLYGIARNAVIDFNRRRSVRPALAAHEPDSDPEALTDSIEQAVLRWQVAAALERLTPEHREVDPARALPGAHPARGRRAHRVAARHGQEPRVVRAARAAARARGDGGAPVTAGCETCRELIGGYVLDALEPDERERGPPPHARPASPARASTRSSRPIPALLDVADSADAVPPRPPPARSRRRSSTRFARERRGAARGPPAPAPRPVATPPRRGRPGAGGGWLRSPCASPRPPSRAATPLAGRGSLGGRRHRRRPGRRAGPAAAAGPASTRSRMTGAGALPGAPRPGAPLPGRHRHRRPPRGPRPRAARLRLRALVRPRRRLEDQRRHVPRRRRGPRRRRPDHGREAERVRRLSIQARPTGRGGRRAPGARVLAGRIEIVTTTLERRHR